MVSPPLILCLEDSRTHVESKGQNGKAHLPHEIHIERYKTMKMCSGFRFVSIYLAKYNQFLTIRFFLVRISEQKKK